MPPNPIFTVLLLAHYFAMLPVSCIEESFCAGLGFDNYKDNGTGLQSMGSSKWYLPVQSGIWAANHIPEDMNRQDRAHLQIVVVKAPFLDGTTGIMNGWLHVTLTKNLGTFLNLAIWALTDEREPFGEFVSFLPSTSDDMLVPCSASPVSSSINPNMFVYTADRWNPSPGTVEVLWKADQSECEKPKQFRFMIAMNTYDWSTAPYPYQPFQLHEAGKGPAIYATSWFTPRLYGQATPVTWGDQCDTCDLVHFSQVKPRWLEKNPMVNGYYGLLADLEDEWFQDRWAQNGSELSDVVESRYVCRAKHSGTKKHFVDFGGRCGDRVIASKQVSGTNKNPPKCLFKAGNFHADDLQRLQKGGPFKVFVDGKRTKQLTDRCDCPPVPPAANVTSLASSRQSLQLLDPLPYVVEGEGCHHNLAANDYDRFGLCKNSVAGYSADGVRMWHAIAHLVCSMVLIPVSCFMARFMKGQIPQDHETEEPHLPVRWWYFIHIAMALPTICMYVTSHSSVSRQTHILGHSKNAFATFHRQFGIAIMALFGFQCLTGFLRPLGMKTRKCTILLHWFLGSIVHYGSVAVCILTYLIPASPFSFKSHLDQRFSNVFQHFGPTAVIVWLCIDVIFQIYVQMSQMRFDKSRLVADVAIHFPVIIPVPMQYYVTLKRNDFERHDGFLKKLFYFYISFCVMSFSVAVSLMSYLNLEEIQGFGPMECTHDDSDAFTAGLMNETKDFTAELILQRKGFCSNP